MAHKLQLSLLGNLRIVYEGQVVTGDLPVKAQAMLCYLAMTGETHTRQALAGLFWGDSPEDKALTSLRVTLNRLRKLLPDALEVTHLTIAFNRTCDHGLDAHTFEQQMRAARSDDGALRSALDLYRGDFLADFFVGDAADFEEWVLAQRARYQQLALSGLQTLTDAMLAQRAYTSAITILTRRIAIEPWSEEAHQTLMLIYSRMGNFNAALAQYDACVEMLEEELGVEPMPETTALYERVNAARTARPHNLPAESMPFIGRETELAQVLNLLTNPDCRLVTIAGFGGMGKTRLAEEAARQATQEQAVLFLNGVAFVSLVGVQSAESVPQLIADAMGIDLPGQRNPARELVNYLRNREALLVLDNFEQLAQDGATLLGKILDGCPSLKLLVTSREPLNLAAEWRVDLEGLAYPPPLLTRQEKDANKPQPRPFLSQQPAPQKSVEDKIDLASFGAVQLFIQTARQIQPGFALSAENAPHVRQLCALVVGMPLALKLAAGWLRTMPIARIAVEVQQNLDLLSTHLRDVPDRQRSMRVVFDYTWKLLQPEEQAVFPALSVFQGGFSEDAIAAVTKGDKTTYSPHLLAGLVDRSLVQVGFGPTGIRYSIHELLRQFGSERLASDATQEAVVRSRHSQYYLGFLCAHKDALQGQGQRAALDELAQEIDNIRAGWTWCVAQHDLVTIDQAQECLYRFYWLRSRAREGRDVFAHAVSMLQSAGNDDACTAVLSRLTAHWGMFCYFLGDYEEASQHLNASLATARTRQLHATAASALTTLGSIAAWQGNRDVARAQLREGLDIWRASGDESGTADALHELAQLCALVGDFTEARELSAESLAICRRIGRADWIGYALDTLGWAEFALGNYDDAYLHYEESRATFEELGHHLGVALALGGTASVAWARGGEHLGMAQKQMMRSLTICREIGHLNHQASRLWYLAQFANDRADHAEAQRLSQQGLEIARDLGNAVLTGFNLGALGVATSGLGDVQESRRYLEEALATTSSEKLLPPMTIALFYFASMLLCESQTDGLSANTRSEKQRLALAVLDALTNHPACWRIFRDRATALRAELVAIVPSDIVAQASELTAAQPLEHLIDRLLP